MTDSDKDQTITQLNEEIKTLKSAIALLPGNVYWKDTQGRYLGCNNNVAKILKLNSPEEIVGKSDADLMDKEFAGKTNQVDLKVVKNKNSISAEEPGFDEHNNPAIYLTQKSPLLDHEGKVKGILGVSLDITDRKRAEENLKIAKQKAEAANRAKSRFLATISHELRTPLTSILGFASLMEELKVENAKEKEYIQNIAYSGSYLLSLINNLLDYNRLETGNFQLLNLPLDLKKLIADIINMLSGAAKLKNLPLELDYPENIPHQIIADRRGIQQILINLIGNAIKFTEKGRIVVRVTCSKDTDKFAELHIAVKDTGVGIPKHEQTSVFKRFYQLGNVYTRNTSLNGTGLGLAIVKKLVKLMDGKITVTSKPDEGSTFCFIATFNKTSLTDTPIDLDPSQHAIKAHVLLVEDDVIIQIVHKKLLESLGVTVDIVGSAKEALAKLNNNYDILFIDLGLPDIDGFELISKIRARHDRISELPIIALTGYSEEEERQRCLQVGADEVAIKPISKKALGQLIARYLKE